MCTHFHVCGMNVLPTCMSGHHICAVPLKSRRELLVTMVLESDPAPLQEQPALNH